MFSRPTLNHVRPHLLSASRVAVLATILGGTFAHGTVSYAAARTQASTSSMVQMNLVNLGYNDDLVLSGPRPSTALAFPLPEGGISKGTVTLNLALAQVINPRSVVTISLNNQPQISLTAAEIRKNPTITLPVKETNEQYLTVGINGELSDSENRCDVSPENFWMTVGSGSSLSYQPTNAMSSIHSFLSMPGGEVVVRGLWDTPQQRVDSIALYSTVKHMYSGTPTNVVLDDAASASEDDSLVRTISLADAVNAAPLTLSDTTLSVAPNRDAMREMVTQAGQPLLFGSSVSAINKLAPVTQEARSDNKLSLSDLGLNDQERAGTGVMPTSIRFTLADIGGWPRDLRFHLNSAFDQIDSDSRERAFVRVRLNNTLIDTIDIRGASSLQRDIVLPAELIQPENFLAVEFVYAPLTGDCTSVPYSFTGQIHSNSSLTWSGYDANRHIISELIGNFSGDGSLFLLDDSAEGAHAAAHLIGNLSAYTAEPLTPQLADPATLATKPASGYRIVVGGDSATAQTLALPLDLGSEVTITDPQTKQEVLRGQPNESLVSAQYVFDGTPTLAVQRSPGADTATLDAAIARFTDPKYFFALNGDTVVSNGSNMVALSLSGDKFDVEANSAPSWIDQITMYRWFLILPAALLIAGLWWLVYRRVGQKPPMPVVPAELNS